jgi:hypothetical protein
VSSVKKFQGGQLSSVIESLVLKNCIRLTKQSFLEYHKKCLLDATDFLEVLINPSASIQL